MKYFITFLLIALSVCTNKVYSQTTPSRDTLKGFWGIEFGATKENAIKILTAKSITATEKSAGKITTLSVTNAVFANRKALVITLRFIDTRFFEATVNYDTKSPHIRSDFESIANGLDEKFFKGNRFANFKYPYKEKDEYEETALGGGYGKLESFWSFGNDNVIGLETKFLEKYSYVTLTYQDSKLWDEAHKESIKTSDY